jgi:hypothetical protein
MKTVTISQAKPQLGKLVDEVYSGAPVVLVHGNKLVKMERYEILDPEYDSPELATMLLDAVRGPHAPYSHKEMRTIADRAIRITRRRRK